jgi:predicted adenylyl cyclase CyaB
VEIKAKLRDRAGVEEKTKRLTKIPAEEFEQEDVFFHTRNGRLKLRIINGRRAELIQYDREDSSGPKVSTYTVVPTDYPDRLREALEKACGLRAVVRKTRRLYWVKNTRIHLDRVEGLGDYVEFEVVLGGTQTVEDGERIARELIAELGIEEGDLVQGAYVDLLQTVAK